MFYKAEMGSDEIIQVFNRLFRDTYRTELVGGGHEPLYQPNANSTHNIIFRADYAASALHEVAHWCMAGEERRQLKDYGYWYFPEGRSPERQEEFERMEVKPQSMEWLFASASDVSFHVSVDNLQGAAFNPLRLRQSVHKQALYYRRVGLPRRAARFFEALQAVRGSKEKVDRFWDAVESEGILPL